METIDPATGKSLPADSIQRVLFIGSKVHVYNIPPMTSGKGHVAALWTADGNKRQIFTARLRVIETAVGGEDEDGQQQEKMKTDIVLEDPSNGQLFAAAPYTSQAVVEPVSDSSRFFALRVQDEAGRKASLGVGFEERGEAFDFGVSLQEARKSLGWDQQGGGSGGRKKPAAVERKDGEEKRDYSLKEGETITVNLPGRFGRRRPESGASSSSPGTGAPLSSFSLPPPPSASATRAAASGLPPPPPPPPPPASSTTRGAGILPPPPSAPSSGAPQHQQQPASQSGQGPGPGQPSAEELGFDDGKFGEFA